MSQIFWHLQVQILLYTRAGSRLSLLMMGLTGDSISIGGVQLLGEVTSGAPGLIWVVLLCPTAKKSIRDPHSLVSKCSLPAEGDKVKCGWVLGACHQ